MNETNSNDRLNNVMKGQVLSSQADLDPRDKPLLEIADWCQQRGTIVVLKSGIILTTDPVSRDVQNCKTMLINRGIRPGRVMVATQQLITLMLANVAGDEDTAEQEVIEQAESSISTQQQRLRLLVQEAINADISDIHIEVRPEVARIRFRKYGELYLHAEWFPRLGREMASVAFNKETDHATAHFNPLIPQDASMPLRIAGQEVRLRLASMPAHGGFDVVMRILGVGDQANIVTLEQLGYTPEQVYIIQRAVQMPHGAVLLSGPTGSGKTTTLASCMRLIRDTRKVYTIEDPVEKVVPTVTQVPVNTDKDDRSFASFGKAALRMDPDYIVLGEMRDEDTANVMIRAAITGHLVFSTIHTNSAPGIITRLVDMGISQTLLSDSNVLVCLIFQRLVPKLCSVCNIPIHDSKHAPVYMDRWKIFFGEAFDKIRARGAGCQKCQRTGVGGRVVVAEVIWVDEPGRRFIRACDMIGWEGYLRQKGWKNYRDRTIEMVKEGLVDPGDAEALVGEISVYSSEEGFDYGRIREEMAAHAKGS
ncbi:MAG: Flp pilus assembly complex ATPase component TadA [Legionellales bacterium]|nr:Flp pilus assembly complex ATPase component TadA [Legionellales bacterium]